MIDEFACQPIEQLRVTRERSLAAKVVARLHNASPKEHLPRPVYGHPPHERMIRRQQPSCEAEPICGCIVWERRKDGWGVRKHTLTGSIVTASLENKRRPRLGHLLHRHDLRNGIDQPGFLATEAMQF